MTRLKIGPVVVLVLLALLALLAVKRKNLTAEEAANYSVVAVVQVEDTVVRSDRHAIVAFLALTALFAFVLWTALRANEGEAKAMSPARESNAGGTTASNASFRPSGDD
jgi:hypothetical protein